MRGKLRQFRVNAGLTQAQAAQKIGVSQPNYQRWESGVAPIPDDKLKKLAKAFKTSPEAILGGPPPIETPFHDDSVDEDLRYYGKVSIRFSGGGKPLVLSISEGEFRRLYHQLQQHGAFVTVASLANQTAAVRARAIADLRFAGEANDYRGPGISDPRDWEIVEALAGGDVGEFDPAEADRVTDRIMTTDEQYRDMVAEGRIKPDDLAGVRARDQKKTARIFELATKTTYQLSSGRRRRVYLHDPKTAFSAFCELMDFGGGDPDNMIEVSVDGAHRTIFINKDALDYVMVPTHQYLRGKTPDHNSNTRTWPALP
jgi:transcriptional regulator with XRE-family HTH domain